jgi:hypothetical protein
MHKTLNSTRSRSLAVAIFALVVLAQVALNVHRVVDEHAPGKVCEICIGHHQLGDAIPHNIVLSAVFIAFAAISVVVTTHPARRQPASIRSRGPPLL